jgi:hypothetical protein
MFGDSGLNREPDPTTSTLTAFFREDAVVNAPTNQIAAIGDMTDHVLMLVRSYTSATRSAAYVGEHSVLEVVGTGS